MKVKISYTVNLDEVPDKGAELIDKVSDELEQTRWIIESISKKLKEHKDILLSIEELETLSEKISSSSYRIAEVASILKGFLQVKTQEVIDDVANGDYILDEEDSNPHDSVVE